MQISNAFRQIGFIKCALLDGMLGFTLRRMPVTNPFRNLGVLKLAIDAIPFWIRTTKKSMGLTDAHIDRHLDMLSTRVQHLTATLRGGLPTVFALFAATGPSIQGSHIRCVAFSRD